jgi:cell wall assembly regulator SMI1
MVADLIARLDRWIAANRAEYYAQLQPGVTDDALDALERRFELTLPEAFRSLYKWRNGQRRECLDSFQYNRMFLPLEGVAAAKEFLDEIEWQDWCDPGKDPKRLWQRDWVPFTDDGTGNHLCVDCVGEGGGPVGQLISTRRSPCERPMVTHRTMIEWLTELVESMEAGTVEIDDLDEED